MIQERIAEVRVRVRTDVPDAAEVCPLAERIVRAALERCAALLEESAPGRVVLIRRLPLRWRLDESMLDDQAQVEVLARAAADTIARISRPPVLDPPTGDEGAVIFDDEAHLRASHLLALARGRPAWFHDALGEASTIDPLAALAAPDRRATANGTLVRLAREGVLAEVLAAHPAAAVAVFAAALGCDALSAREAGTPRVAAGLVAELAAIASHWPALGSAAEALAFHVHAVVLLNLEVASPEATALAAAAQQGSAALPLEDDSRIPPGSRAPLGSQPVDLPRTGAGREAPLASVTTRCGGLFYLLDRIQELDLAQSLWKACLPEGAVLAAAASTLVGPALSGDAAPALFGGVDRASCPEVTPEQHAEIAIATCEALAAALPRRGLADIPPVQVSLADHPAGRLLVAAAEGFPFAFFAWPAATRGMLKAGLNALLDAWPHRGLLNAATALATLDTSGRVCPVREPSPQPLLLPYAPSAFAAALLALAAGAPSLLFAARAGFAGHDTVEAFFARRLAHPARIRIGAESMDVVFDATCVDFDLRRAGLDRDPGWLPWLRRTVRFIFEQRERAPGEDV